MEKRIRDRGWVRLDISGRPILASGPSLHVAARQVLNAAGLVGTPGSVTPVLPCYRVLDALQKRLAV